MRVWVRPAGIPGVDAEGTPVPPPSDPKTLQTVGLVGLAVAAIGLLAGVSVYGSAQQPATTEH